MDSPLFQKDRLSRMVEVKNRNDDEIHIIQEIASSGNDCPVSMLNLNRYSEAASFPDGELYTKYLSVLEEFLPVVGARILWRHKVLGQPIGNQKLDEILAAWYPSHQAFLDLFTAPGSDENFRLRGLAVEYAVIHRFPGDVNPFSP
jgi:hypothetical protein